ncbi:V-type proton ATPase 116 kDa subunit a1 [Frankliniella fusca]|uniref:V-type proton ATPase subunit a n=1 Tax=Frankliniella fusca TaxID=407009 RepID=A0AAE1LEQ9_9NEOP|nr:V-type proton ATPase 116 kDa subunit a1 [Frankliniella fusca]
MQRFRMGAMFRSEQMTLCQLFLQPEAAYTSVSALGEMGIAQFRDMNAEVNPFMRKFVSEVRRCDELERKLRYIEEEVRRDDVKIPDLEEAPTAPNPREIIDLEAHLEKTETEMLELSQNGVNLKSNFKELKEMKYVLEKAQHFMSEECDLFTAASAFVFQQEESDSNRALIGGEERGRLGFVAGVIPRDKVPGFERMLWRVSRGNVFLRQAPLEEPLEDPATGQPINKTVFVAFYQGENLKSRLKKVCTGYHATLYTCPSSVSEREGVVRELRIRLEDLNVVLSQTMDHRHRVVQAVAKELQTWKAMVRKMKAIYHTLNMFNMDVTNKCLIGECWVPKDELQHLRRALEDGGKAVGSTINPIINILSTTENPPTFIRTNKFTEGFQVLIDAYAVGTYREVNPASFTTITFPFLFSVMFGDLGHGIVVFLFAGWMCLFEKKLKKNKWGEIWDIFFGGRYIILLMGIFSMYSGLLYNDIFSLSLNIFGSGWVMNIPKYNLSVESKLALDPAEGGYRGDPYYMGLDPVWQSADNKIIFLNSFKMKLSIIIAVVHMVFGICLSVVNFVHMKKYINILLDFVPQIIFLVLLFGYMAFMVVYKYIVFSPYSQQEIADDPSLEPWGTRCAPSVLITFINMVLVSANSKVEGCNQYMFGGQEEIQRAFLVIALLMVPVLLLGKPIYIKMSARRQATHQVLKPATNGDVSNNGIEMTGASDPEQGGHVQPRGGQDHGEHGESFSDVMVHQAIHTVEYVLSTVSHTASYLRLWALSLAHAQLSDVLWNMVFRRAIKIAGGMGTDGSFSGGNIAGGFVIYVVFALWVCFTVAVLVLMEGLSAFLHTLRLHWVEFMSKFYTGSGYPFEPFSFKGILKETNSLD